MNDEKKKTDQTAAAAPNTLEAARQSRIAARAKASDTKARQAFTELGAGGSFDKLTESGRDAVRAFAAIADSDVEDKVYDAAKQAALDAIRDARQVGLLDDSPAPAPQPTEIAESKDPAVKNQQPTGAQRT